MKLTNIYDLCTYIPSGSELAQEDSPFDTQVARVGFSVITAIMLMYDAPGQRLDRMCSVDACRQDNPYNAT